MGIPRKSLYFIVMAIFLSYTVMGGGHFLSYTVMWGSFPIVYRNGGPPLRPPPKRRVKSRMTPPGQKWYAPPKLKMLKMLKHHIGHIMQLYDIVIFVSFVKARGGGVHRLPHANENREIYFR